MSDECDEPDCICGDYGCPCCEDDKPCAECGGDNDTNGRLCTECRKDDCLNCGTCADCIRRSIDAAEAEDRLPRSRQNCNACGRGMIQEDVEMGIGMCIPCAGE